MQSDFNSFMNEAGSPATGLLTKEDYSLAHGHIVKWGVVEILPLKSEIEAIGERNPSIPIHKQVPWEAGIVMAVLALKSKDHRGNVRDLYAVDPNGNVTLPYGPKYMGQWVKTDTGEVERGWARKDGEGIEEAARRLSEKLEKEGITIENARFNPVARAVRFTTMHALQWALRAWLFDQLAVVVEPVSEFGMALYDLLDMFGPPEDEDEIIDALLAVYPEGHPFWDNPDNIETLHQNPLFRQYREKKFEAVLNRLAMSSPVGGLVVSQLLKFLGAHLFGPLAGVDYRPSAREVAQSVFSMASTRSFAQYLADVIGKLRDKDADPADFWMNLTDPLLPKSFDYWQRKMRQETESVIKASYPLQEPHDAGRGIDKTSRVDPVEKQAKANIQRVRNEARREGVIDIPGLEQASSLVMTKGGLWNFLGDREKTQLGGIYVTFERARLGSPDAMEKIQADPVKYPPGAYAEWVRMMKRRGVPATIDPAWVKSYVNKAWPAKKTENVEVEIPY